MFLGVDGIELNQGLTHSHPQEAEVLRMLARHSKHLVVVADSSKIGSVSKWLLCPTAEIHEIITDTGAMDEKIAPFEAIGIKVHGYDERLNGAWQPRQISHSFDSGENIHLVSHF